MDPQKQWCHNPDCPARGQVGQDSPPLLRALGYCTRDGGFLRSLLK